MIIFNEKTMEFHLQAKDTSYIFTILRNNQLGHLYYGKKIRHKDSFAHLITERNRSNVSNIYGGQENFSLEVCKQEYPSYGTTDYREPAFQILQEDGSRITNFEYNGHQIFKGKKPLDGLRSEEHTSELQSRGHLVCRLLLEKKKKILYTN